jgi:putative peptidoglycan lipid II flippase
VTDQPSGRPAAGEPGGPVVQDPPQDPAPGLARTSTVMAVGTTASRILGYVRNIVVATAIGTQLLGSSYTVANNVPNVIYILLAGGVLNSVFVPQIVRAMKERSDGGDEYVHRLLTLSLLVLLGITVIATVSAPLIIDVYAGDNWGAAEFATATAFAYWCLPQILFYGIFTVLGQVLNARGRFGPMMWTPVLNNVVVIATGLLFLAVVDVDPGAVDAAATISGAEIALLGAGTTLGIVVQALALVPLVRASGYRYRPRFDFRGHGLGRAGQLAKWTLAFVAVNQVGYLVITRVATSVDKAAEGVVPYGVGYAAYTNAYLMWQLPHAIVAVSVATAMLPRMSAAVTEGRLPAVRADYSSGLRLVGVAIVPAAVALLVLGPDIGGVLYASVDLTSGPGSARAMGLILSGFSLGLVAFSAQYLTHQGFYALEDTRTPFFVAVLVNLVNVAGILLAWTLLPVGRVTVGMAASYAVACFVGWFVSLALLRRRLGSLDGHRVTRTYVRLVLAAALAGLVAAGVVVGVHRTWGIGFLGSVIALLAGGAILVVTFVLLARAMRITELTGLLGAVRARLPGGRRPAPEREG